MSNTTIININNQEVVFENKDNQTFCTSLDVAKVFGKQHKDILEIIRSKIRNKEIQNFNGRNFSPVKYKDAKGEMRPAYQLTKDGFSFIAMGLTGRKADKFKIAFINAFNEMENIIKNQYTPKLENHNKYNIPNTPYKEDIIKAIMQTEQNRNCEFEELISYEIIETYKDNKSYIKQKVNFIAKG